MFDLFSLRLARFAGWFVFATACAYGSGDAADRGPALQASERSEKHPSEISQELATNPAMLPPLHIIAPPYRLPLTEKERLKLGLFFKWNLDSGWPVIGGDTALTPHRIPENLRKVPVNVTSVSWDRGGTERELDISSFDRLEAISADPVGRIVRDGVPLADPFGDGALWRGAPREGLWRVETVPRGGGNAWGEGAIDGVTQFFTEPAKGRLVEVAANPAEQDRDYAYAPQRVVVGDRRLTAWAGNFGRRGIDFMAVQPTLRGVLQILGRDESLSGRPLIAPRNRGRVDPGEDRDANWSEARWRQPVGSQAELLATLATTGQSVQDGTPGRHHHSRGRLGSISVAGEPTLEFAWNAVVYAQEVSRAAAFTAIAPDRGAETPLFEQPDLSARVLGFAWTGRWFNDRDAHTAMGFDAGMMSGEVRRAEDYFGGAFAHGSIAGGRQRQVGFFVFHDREILPNLRLTFGARFDEWLDDREYSEGIDPLSGVRRPGAQLTDRRGEELSPELGAVWRPTPKARLRIDLQRSFRGPSLGERFAVAAARATVVQPDAELRPEYGRSIRLGAEYRPTAAVTLGVSGFSMSVRDAIGEAAIASGVPSSYELRRRVNFSLRRIEGLKWSTIWRRGRTFAWEAAVTFHRAPGFAFVPREEVVLGAMWQSGERFTLAARVRSAGWHFADDENRQKVPGSVVGDVAVSYLLRAGVEVFGTVSNVADARVERERGADGADYVGASRQLEAGLRFAW